MTGSICYNETTTLDYLPSRIMTKYSPAGDQLTLTKFSNYSISQHINNNILWDSSWILKTKWKEYRSKSNIRREFLKKYWKIKNRIFHSSFRVKNTSIYSHFVNFMNEKVNKYQKNMILRESMRTIKEGW